MCISIYNYKPKETQDLQDDPTITIMSLSLYITRVYYTCNQKKDKELGI